MKISPLGSSSAPLAVATLSLLVLQLTGSSPVFVAAKNTDTDQHAGNLRHATASADGADFSDKSATNDLLEAYHSLSDDDKADFLENVLPKVDEDTIVADPNFLADQNRMLQSTPSTTLASGSFGTCNSVGQIFLCSGGGGGTAPPPTNECSPNPCRNGGSCFTKSDGSFKGCSCPAGFGGEKCGTNLNGGDGGGDNGGGGTTYDCAGQWIKHKNNVCRMGDGSNGVEGKDFKIQTGCDKECCANRCCENPNCKAYEHKGERCELWWTVPTRLEYKEDNRCYIKPTTVGGGGIVQPDSAPWSKCSSNYFSCWSPHIAQIGYFNIQSFGSNKCLTKELRLETCDQNNVDQRFHFRNIQHTTYWRINWREWGTSPHVRGINVNPHSSGSQGKLILSEGQATEDLHSFFKLDYNAQKGTFRIRVYDTFNDSNPQKRLYVTQQGGHSSNDTPLVLRTEYRMSSLYGSNYGHYNLIPLY